MTLRLFLSHCSPDDASQDRLHRLVRAIEDAADGTVRVLYDARQVAGGDAWRPRLGYLLHAADAAVVLLDECALESDWVLAEATFLSIRHMHDRDFRVIPAVFLPDDSARTRREGLAAQHSRLRTGAWHPADLPSLHFVSGQTPEQVGVRIVTALEVDGPLVVGKTIVEEVAAQVEPHLRTAPRTALMRLAGQLGRDVPYEARDLTMQSALAITRGLIELPDLAEVRRLLRQFGSGFATKHGQDVVDALAPLPIDPSAAVHLLRRRNALGYRHTGLRAARSALALLYVRRAYLPEAEPRVLVINSLYGTADSIRLELREALRGRAALAGDEVLLSDPDDGELDEQLAADPMYAVLPGLDQEVLDQLSALYPALSFIVLDAGDVEPPAGLTRLIPEMELTDQRRLLWEWLHAGVGSR